jgi:hypothetical protein
MAVYPIEGWLLISIGAHGFPNRFATLSISRQSKSRVLPFRANHRESSAINPGMPMHAYGRVAVACK